jgi:hypothetical protein
VSLDASASSQVSLDTSTLFQVSLDASTSLQVSVDTPASSRWVWMPRRRYRVSLDSPG